MKIIVCGIPPAQSRTLERRFPGHDLRVIGAQETEQRYLAHMRVCDLCVVNVRLISHKVCGIIRRTMPDAVMVNGPSSAEAAINERLNRRGVA